MKRYVKDVDYYLEEGRVHFTNDYLVQRGSCCGGTCTHCPYIERIKGVNILKDKLN